jgi:FkbM family methyltransferase
MSGFRQLIKRMIHFPGKSSREKLSSYADRWNRWFGLPAPVRRSGGIWWLTEMDFLGQSLLANGYEDVECKFAESFLRPGMKVLDIGAHQGFHTLIFSKKVGRHGRVVAFEPSLKDRQRLNLHLNMNFCANVTVKGCALGRKEETANLYRVPQNSVCNSLRPPDIDLASVIEPVSVRKLDDVLAEMGMEHVDFVKLDVEGAELGVLEGAQKLLGKTPRPTILCEVLEQRTRPWGYPARRIIETLAQKGFVWFELSRKAELLPVSPEQSEFHGNFVAVPQESLTSGHPAQGFMMASASTRTSETRR